MENLHDDLSLVRQNTCILSFYCNVYQNQLNVSSFVRLNTQSKSQAWCNFALTISSFFMCLKKLRLHMGFYQYKATYQVFLRYFHKGLSIKYFYCSKHICLMHKTQSKQIEANVVRHLLCHQLFVAIFTKVCKSYPYQMFF